MSKTLQDTEIVSNLQLIVDLCPALLEMVKAGVLLNEFQGKDSSEMLDFYDLSITKLKYYCGLVISEAAKFMPPDVLEANANEMRTMQENLSEMEEQWGKETLLTWEKPNV